MLAVDKPLAYHKPEVQVQIAALLDKVAASPSLVNGSIISWLVRMLHHILQWFIHIRAQGLSKVGEHPTYTAYGVGLRYTLYLYFLERHAMLGCRAYAKACVSVSLSITLVDFDHAWCNKKWKLARQDVGVLATCMPKQTQIVVYLASPNSTYIVY